MHHNALRLILASFVLCSGFAITALAQTAAHSPAQEATKPPAKENDNPFAPEPAGPLPAGMPGADTTDPRAKLTPGVYDAGEAAMGIKHLQLVKNPDAFQLGSNDPSDPK